MLLMKDDSLQDPAHRVLDRIDRRLLALLPSFAAPCGTNAQGRQDVPFIPSQALILLRHNFRTSSAARPQQGQHGRLATIVRAIS